MDARMNSADEMARCVEICLKCASTCLGTAMNHCLEVGGKHAEPKHFRLMMACAEVCRTAAHLMLMNTPHHKNACRECVDVCNECADDCARIGGMDECVAQCRECALSCEAMVA